MAFENWRFNPFTGTMNDIDITDEQHTVEYHSDWNAYGIQLDEAPQLDNPSSLSIVESGTGGIAFTEVPRTQAPSTGQFRVDYDAATYYGTGRIEFNAADNGKTVLVTYKGGGWIVKNSYRAFQTYIAANLNVTEDADIDGDLNVEGALVVDGISTLTGAVSAPGGITGNLTGDVTGDVTGNADTATEADSALHAHAIIETGTGESAMRWKIIDIGDWNMDATGDKTIDVGVAIMKIRSISVIIRNDANNQTYNLNSTYTTGGGNGYYYTTSTSSINIRRIASGFFDSTDFDLTSFNRGYITIGYID